MGSISDFSEQHPEFQEEESSLVEQSLGLRLDVNIRGISESLVKFSHMGTDYSVSREHILDIVERQDGSTANSAGAATITVDRNAPMLASYSISAADLAGALPFSLSCPPSSPGAPIRPSAREFAWRRETGYLMPVSYEGAGGYPSLEKFLSPYGTATGCDSRTGGGWDDTETDDQRTDY